MKVKCSHCGLEFERAAMIKDGNDFFCCNGCQGVFHLLHSENLDSFYEKRAGASLEPVKIYEDEPARFDSKNFYDSFVKTKDGLCYVSLIIEGIHCAACVWLNEKVLEKQEGIVDLNINFTTHKAKISWDDGVIKLSHIIELIRSIGYNAYPYDPFKNEEKAYKERKEYFTKMIFSVFTGMNIMWLALAKYLGYFGIMDDELKNYINIAEFLLATPTIFYSGQIFLRGAYYSLKNFIINMDFLVIFGSIATYVFSIWAAFIEHTDDVYFDSATMIITFVLVGKFLEVRSKKIGVDTLDTLSATIPNEVTLIKGGQGVATAVSDIKIGDVIETKPGEKFIFDAQIISGKSTVNTANINGESIPVDISEGSTVLGGYENISGAVRSRVSKSLQNSTMYSIISLLEEAMGKKSSIETKTNEISKWFSVVILALAIGTFFWWEHFDTIERAIIVSVSVIVVACPCALALATPIANIIGISIASKDKILFKEPDVLEKLAKASVLVLDKTGTITKAKPKVYKNTIVKKFDYAILYSLVSRSNHPISVGVREFLPKSTALEMDVTEEMSMGLVGKHDGKRYYGGNLKFIESKIGAVDLELSDEYSIFIFADVSEVLAVFYLDDEIKEDAKDAIAKIRKMGLRVILASGDKDKNTKKVAKLVGIDEVWTQMMPQDKLDLIEREKRAGNIVVSTGDGINDALMLTGSDISIAMHTGADTAINLSDIVLLNSNLNALKNAILISRRTYKFIKQNLTSSLIYNAITVPVAMAGYLIPLIAAALMSVSSILVVLNSLRIKLIKK
ncbi:MAG: heavy metal translocating P-type ATPase [Helicobacteraceae bacterium]